ncbi:MAG: hypothetical protein NTX56_03970 [Proteobacteria bacterium]|nr:hypothetical protein [Pseudomonadota bacterium]
MTETDREIATYASLMRSYVKKTEAGARPADVYLTFLRDMAGTPRTTKILVAALLEAGANHDHVARAYRLSF